MNIFRKLRWKLTFNYTIVTVSAFLVVVLILVGIVLPRIYVPNNIVTPELLISIVTEKLKSYGVVSFLNHQWIQN